MTTITDISRRREDGPSLDDVEYEEGRLVIPPALPIGAWMELGESLRFRERNVQFWLGDWYRYGRIHYGEEFSQALEETGYSKHTIQNCASVAEAIEPARRRPEVPFSHHEAVAGLPPADQDALLAEAADSEMPLAEMRAKVRHLKVVAEPEAGAYCWTAVCRTCQAKGPNIDCKPGDMQVDRGALCRWLGDHQRHEVLLLGEERMPTWTEQ